MKASRLCVAVLAVTTLSAALAPAEEPVTATVRFRIERMRIGGRADRPASAPEAEQPRTATIQRGQWMMYTFGGGQAPYVVFSDNAVVKPERISDTTWKVVAQSTGTSQLTIVDSAGGYSNATLNVIEDRYGAEATIFDNSNGLAVSNRPASPTTFTAATGFRLTLLRTYHYNGGSGSPAGQIGLKHEDGRVFGPWMATRDGNHWVIRPNAAIPPGRLTVIDSEPATWSWNSRSQTGFATVSGMARLPNP